MRKFLSLLFFISIIEFCFAQKGTEVKLPVQNNFRLKSYSEELQKTDTRKMEFFMSSSNDTVFPFIERFTNPGTVLDGFKWADNSVRRVGQTAVFDAYDAYGNVHSGGTFGWSDTLTSLPFHLTTNRNVYVELNYSTGSTWSSGDSLILQFQKFYGTGWTTVWVSSNAAVSNKTISVLINPDADSVNYLFTTFRLVNITRLDTSNTQDFILNYFVFAQKWNLPVYDNILNPGYDSTAVSFPQKQLWSQAKTTVYSGPDIGLTWCNVAVFDALDENLSVYSNGTSGYADTLCSHEIDLTSFSLSDSVYLRFFYRAMPNSKPSDQLILQARDSAFNWIPLANFTGSPFTDFRAFITQINIGKLRSNKFQFRLINTCNYSSSDTLKWVASGFNIGKKFGIPFVDDFSTSEIYPDQTVWQNKNVYINNNFPVRPPSFNVATFDGLDQNGNAYGVGRGYCDTLATWPINLSGLTKADSVYLSFFIEPTGNGSRPYATDSFIVQMRNVDYDPAAFINVWSDVAANYPDTLFTQIMIRVDSTFLHDDFQIRFMNRGSLTGNLDHWHLDYVRLDRGRSLSDIYYNDWAVSEVPNSLLKTYTSMPWKHFIVSPKKFETDTQYFRIKNNGTGTSLIPFQRLVFNEQPLRLDSFRNFLPGFLPAGSDTLVAVRDSAVKLIPFDPTRDSIIFTATYSHQISTDYIPSNNKLSVQTIFSNYYAYDDGSAEAGYAIANTPGSVALGYHMPNKDTLFGIAVFFNQSSINVAGLPFNLMVWSAVGTPPAQTGETVLTRILFQNGPVYQNKINGFYYFKFDQPIPVDTLFYIGWEQTQTFELNVGLDQNYKINGQPALNPDMYYKTTDVPIWQPTELTGALMMRPIIAKWINMPVGVNEIRTVNEKFDVLVYPNPARNSIYFDTKQSEILNVELYDMTGRLIVNSTVNQELNLPPLNQGIYILRIKDKKQNFIVKKIIIE